MRRAFSKPTMRAALERSEGRCEAIGILYGLHSGERCNAPLNRGKIFDHVTADGIGGEPTLENCLVICPTCNSVKTNHGDIPRIAKMKRQRDDDLGIRSTKSKPLPGGRGSRLKKRMDGRVQDRITGEIL
jgi:5-methylcytosine-specific restriction protein A